MTIHFFVPGEPKSQGSKTSFKHPKTGAVITTEAVKGTKAWRTDVKQYAEKAMEGKELIASDPVRLSVAFLYARPKTHFGTGRNSNKLKPKAPDFKTSKPDLGKLIRAVEDAMKFVVWRDDSQVVKYGQMIKRYCAPTGEKPGALITISTDLY